jgi:ATP-binding protein involved in chromosome partitioning
MEINQEKLVEILKTIQYPPKNSDIVSLGMVKDLKLEGNKITFSVVFDSFNNPHEKAIKEEATRKIKEVFGDNVDVHVRAIGKVNVDKVKNLKNAGQITNQSLLNNVKHIITVSSGKGGVGKSTVSVNLAIALAKTGAKVGLLDADMYGPSVPRMLDLEGARPVGRKVNGKDMIAPIERFGVSVISIGFFVKKEDAIIWRGAMVTNALKQLITDVDWGELDYLVIDAPPGTGDVQLTVAQYLKGSKGLVVTTPQDVALNDVRRAINMFRAKGVEIPVLGIIENMSWFECEEAPGKKYYIFGKGGGKKLADETNLPLLGEIPILEEIREDGDKGLPTALDDDTPQGKAFNKLAENVINELKKYE